MIHRMLRYPAGWEWHVLLQPKQQPEGKPLPSRKAQRSAGQPAKADTARTSSKTREKEKQSPEEIHLIELKRQFPECASWLDECAGRRTNHISVDELHDIGPLLCGTLMIQVSDDQSDIQPFHFWLSRNRLVTMHEDMRLPLRLQTAAHTLKYDGCAVATEAFFIMTGAILETFHAGLDGFERRLGELERTMRIQNRTGLLDTIFERRYDLLHWNHLFIPIREVHGAAKEAFAHELTAKDAFIRITHKLERIDTLLKHYASEIDTLISMDDAISSFRGNDIMKTLTIFTVLFLPATIAGTIWGSNFDRLPWRHHPLGFVVMIAAVAVITAGIYVWLWKKGWTGDLLNRRKSVALIADRSKRQGKRRDRSRNNSLSDAESQRALTTTDQLTRSRKRRV